MTVVDASVWIDYLNGHPSDEANWLDEQLSIGIIGVPDLVLCEVLQGVRSAAEFERTRQILLSFHSIPLFDQGLCIAAAQNFRVLRERGYTIRSTIDCLIATFCIQGGYPLLHRDKDFAFFERELGLLAIKP